MSVVCGSQCGIDSLNTKDTATELQCFPASICTSVKWEYPVIRLLRGRTWNYGRRVPGYHETGQSDPMRHSLSEVKDVLTGVGQAGARTVIVGEALQWESREGKIPQLGVGIWRAF